MRFQISVFASLLASLFLLQACSVTGPYDRVETAKRIAGPAFMIHRTIPAGPFLLTAYERIHKRGSVMNLYIEGDGLAWLSRSSPSLDPTPNNPVALNLAALDKAGNVGYLARPCQFSKLINKQEPCDAAYWTNKRYAPEVIAAYQSALDEIKARYQISGFNLIGFSGGAGIAALVAAERDDIVSLRSVAGNLDHKTHSEFHNVTILEASLNPADFTDQLSDIPQYHFIGGQDKIVPPVIYNSYKAKFKDHSCLQSTVIQDADHDKGWVDKWPELLKLEPKCQYRR